MSHTLWQGESVELTQYVCGPGRCCVQITQYAKSEPGVVQLSRDEAFNLANQLILWVNSPPADGG